MMTSDGNSTKPETADAARDAAYSDVLRILAERYELARDSGRLRSTSHWLIIASEIEAIEAIVEQRRRELKGEKSL